MKKLITFALLGTIATPALAERIVEPAADEHDFLHGDLDMPQTVENGEPGGDNVFQLRVETEFGGFVCNGVIKNNFL